MTNYAPADARMTLLFQKRKVVGPAPQRGMVLNDSNGCYVLDLLPYYRIEFDTDIPGETVCYLEPFSEREGTTSAGDTDLPFPYAYPIKAIEIVDGQPSDVFRFYTGV